MKRIGELLVEAGVVSQAQVDQALRIQAQHGKRLGQTLVELGMATDADVARALAMQQGLEFIVLTNIQPPAETLALVPPEIALKHSLIPVERTKRELRIALADPLNLEALKDIEFRTGLKAVPQVAALSDLASALERYYGKETKAPTLAGTEDELELIMDEVSPFGALDLGNENASVIPVVNAILANAVTLRASDIHLEPQEASLLTRYRIDGLLQDILNVPKGLQESVLSRIKILSNLDIAERRKPQDGRIKLRVKGQEVDLRISTLPALYGERIVIRVLEKSMATISLDRLGFSPGDAEDLRSLLSRNQGIILVTGPTGSGKTTTLYACLNHLKYYTKNIITVEDPVEYRIPGINQVPANEKAGLTFATGLRSILRQDPNIIMVGEIRDQETAEISLRASLTGHLVLSTMHTNDAASTVARLLDIGIESHLIASTLAGVVAQRLVRSLCKYCQEAYDPDPDLLRTLGLSREAVAGRKFLRGRGCDACHHTGYHGRIGVFELLRVNDTLKELIARRAPQREIFLTARKAGMHTLEDDALAKIFSGVTSAEEILRVVPPRFEDRKSEDPKSFHQELGPSPSPDRLPDQKPQGESLGVQLGCKPSGESVPVPPGRASGSGGSEQSPAGAGTLSARPTLAKERVLIVEDDPGIREMLAALLRIEHYEVVTASDGEEALERIYEQPPDLLITDVVMPRMDGFSLCRKLRSHRATNAIPIIVLTTKSGVEDEVRGLELGADDYIPKPIDSRRLLARMRRLLLETRAP